MNSKSNALRESLERKHIVQAQKAMASDAIRVTDVSPSSADHEVLNLQKNFFSGHFKLLSRNQKFTNTQRVISKNT